MWNTFWGRKQWHEKTSNNYYVAHTANNAHTLTPSPYVRLRGKRLCVSLWVVVFPAGEGWSNP